MTAASMDDRISRAYQRLEECQQSSESARRMNKVRRLHSLVSYIDHSQDTFFTPPCRTCSELLYVLNFPTDGRIELKLGTLQQLRESDCQNHDIVFPFNHALLKRTIFLRRPTVKPLVYVYPDPSRFNDGNRPDAPWELLNGQGEIHELFGQVYEGSRPRVVDDTWIDLKMLRGWRAECERNHCTNCAIDAPSLAPDSYALILVDSVQKCLVWKPPSCRYVALSYVWGTSNSFVTTREDLQQLSAPGVLEQSETSQFKLPKTIIQAIELTNALRERYLWVDGLCIVQDGDDKAEQLNAMASVYTNAVLTIVAASGSGAGDGFRGLPGISAPRRIVQHIAPLSSRQQIMRPSSKHIWDEKLAPVLGESWMDLSGGHLFASTDDLRQWLGPVVLQNSTVERRVEFSRLHPHIRHYQTVKSASICLPDIVFAIAQSQRI